MCSVAALSYSSRVKRLIVSRKYFTLTNFIYYNFQKEFTMSEDEMEKFEITDYDLENEFNINRNRKRVSKHHQIYGNKSFSLIHQTKKSFIPISFLRYLGR